MQSIRIEKMNDDPILDPIKEAGNRYVAKLRKKKAETNKRKEEAIIRSRMRNKQNVEFQPDDILKLFGVTKIEISPDPSSSSSSTSCGSSSGYLSASTSCSNKSQGSSASLHDQDKIKIRNQKGYRSYSSNRENNTPVDERKIVFVGRLEKDVTKQKLGNEFSKFGRVVKVRLHSKENGFRYGFVTYERARDAWSAVRAAGTFAQYDVRFGAHCAFSR